MQLQDGSELGQAHFALATSSVAAAAGVPGDLVRAWLEPEGSYVHFLTQGPALDSTVFVVVPGDGIPEIAHLARPQWKAVMTAAREKRDWWAWLITDEAGNQVARGERVSPSGELVQAELTRLFPLVDFTFETVASRPGPASRGLVDRASMKVPVADVSDLGAAEPGG